MAAERHSEAVSDCQLSDLRLYQAASLDGQS
jgi:hypothetical protein